MLFMLMTALTPIVLMVLHHRYTHDSLPTWALFLVCVFATWLVIQLGVWIVEMQREAHLASFDLNGDGLFSGDELTAEQHRAMMATANDTAQALAPVTGAIFAVVYVGGLLIVRQLIRLVKSI